MGKGSSICEGCRWYYLGKCNNHTFHTENPIPCWDEYEDYK